MGLDLGKLSATIEVRTNGVDTALSKVEQGLDKVGRKADDVSRKQIKPKVDAGDLDKAASSADKAKKAVSDVGGRPVKITADSSDLDTAVQKAGSLKSVLGSLGGVAGLAVGAAGIAGFSDALGKIVSTGNSFTNEMNTMQAVSSATADEMKRVSQAARELGNDVTLPSTSASDAAAAMTELAKGGFSVQQSMDAAKGTLQLAAAAQIDAATAATIQSQALQAYGLDASYAAKAADVLANTANASSAEITDVAQGLQQAGTVTNQFGVSLEDTSAMLAMFANAGIKGSDAGTLLKTGLLALTDQGKPAQAAIEELGLTVYDASGKFVGMRSLMEQLEEASKNMTDEQYQAATATLFGSDAMRLAGLAAEKGVAGFDQVRSSIEREGAAAEVAAAKTQGLPGAISQVSNATEELGMKLYDLADGPAEAGLKSLAGGITSLSDNMDKVPFPVYAAGIGLIANKVFDLGGKATATTSAIRAQAGVLGGQWKLAMSNAQVASQNSARSLQIVAQKHREAAAAAQAQALASKNTFVTVDRMGAQAASGFAARTASMHAAAKGLAGGGMSLLGSAMGGVGTAASGLLGLMGGPWGLAFMAGSAAVGALAQKHAEAKQAEEEHKAAQESLRASLDQTTGAVTEQTRALQLDELRKSGALDAARDFGISQSVLADAATGNVDAMNRVADAVGRGSKLALEGTETWKQYGSEWEKVGLTSDVVTAALNGNADAIAKVEEKAGAGQIESFRKEMGDTGEKAKLLNDKLGTMHDNLAEVQTKAAQDQLNALGRQSDQTAKALQEVGDKIVAIPDTKNIVFSDINQNVRKELDRIGLMVTDMPDGRVNVEFPDGVNITQMLDQMGVKIRSLPDGRITLKDNAKEVQDKMVALGLAVRDKETGEVYIKDNISEVISKQVELGQAVKLENGEVHIKDNTQGVIAALDEVGIKASTIPPGELRVADNTPEVREKLDQIGVKVTELPGGKVVIEDTSPQTLANLNSVGVQTQGLPPGFIQITDTSPENIANLNSVGATTTSLPSGRVLISDNSTETKNNVLRNLANGAIDTMSTHTVNIVRNIREMFTRANGGIDFFANGSENHVAQIAPGGAWRVWAEPETEGEAYIPLAKSKRARSEKILSEVARRFGYGMVPRDAVAFEDGGISDRIKATLAGMNGTPYAFGGWSEAGTDCSGAVSMGVNVGEGLDPFDSRTATGGMAAWLEAKGYQRGKGGPGDMRVAFLNGGPGGGHAAMQLPDGTFIESGGNTGGGLTIGGSAGPLEGRGFTDFYYKPMGTGDGGVSYGGDGSSSGSTRMESGGSSTITRGGYVREFEPIEVQDGVSGVGSTMGKRFTAPEFATNWKPTTARATIGDYPGGSGFLGKIGEIAAQHGVADKVNQALDAQMPSLDMFLKVTKESVEAYNALGKAQDDANEAVYNVKVAEDELADARKEMADADGDYADKIKQAQEDLEKARNAVDSKGNPVKDRAEKVAKAQKKLDELLEDAPRKAKDRADKLAAAEVKLEKARAKQEKTADALTRAQEAYNLALAEAPIKNAQAMLNQMADSFGNIADVLERLNAVAEQGAQIAADHRQALMSEMDAKINATNAAHELARVERENTVGRWQDQMMVEDAEWALAIARRDAIQMQTDAALYGSVAGQDLILTQMELHSLEAAVDEARHQQAANELERADAQAQASADLEYQEALLEIQTMQLEASTNALAQAQGVLVGANGERLSATQQTIQAKQEKSRGIGGFLGGLAKIGGAIFLGMSGNIPAAIALGVSGAGSLVGGAKDYMTGKEREKAFKEEAKKEQEALSPEDKRKIAMAEAAAIASGVGGFAALAAGGSMDDALAASKTISDLGLLPLEMQAIKAEIRAKAIQEKQEAAKQALEVKRQRTELDYKRATLERSKETEAQRKVLLAQLDEARKQTELAKRGESRTKDLLSRNGEQSRQGVFFQLGGLGWGGDATRKSIVGNAGGFGGLSAGGAGMLGSSFRVENDVVTMNRNLLADLQRRGTPTAVLRNETAQQRTANNVAQIVSLLQALGGNVESLVDGSASWQTPKDIIGTVFNGPVTIPNGDKYQRDLEAQLDAALMR